MFEKAFKSELDQLTTDKHLIEELWLEIKNQYSSTGRYYHTLSHIDNLLAELLPVKNKISDWQTLNFSIAYHDIVYDPQNKNNEEKSAQLAYNRLSRLSVPEVQKEKCFSQIMATKGHNQSTDEDTNFFTDADLAILGARQNDYHEYSNMIRKEYRSFPDLIYNTGRKKVLRHFLRMPGIYKTEFFRNKYERQARKNLNNELDTLSS
jgi:predicted metal-dependent HD superfamily phosphohydrolase